MVWIWCHSIDPEYETNAMLLLNFFTTLRQGCAYATMLPWIIHICRSSQSWHNVVEMVRYRSREDVINLTLRVPRCIKAGVATFTYDVRWIYYPKLRPRWHNVVIWRLSIDVEKMLSFWRRNFKVTRNVVNIPLTVHRELNLPTLRKRWSNVIILTL